MEVEFFTDGYIFRLSSGLGVKWYGFLIAIGVALGFYLFTKEFKKRKYNLDDAFDLALYMIVGGFVCARLFYVIFHWSDGHYADNPISALYIWQGGLAIYGGIIGGAIVLYIYSRIKKYNFIELLDMAAPSLVLGQAIGRWGNFFNNEAHGMPVNDKSLQFFPYAVNIQHEWFQATFFYESMTCFLIFAILMLYKNKKKFIGEIILIYTLIYGIERAIVEGMRTDSLFLFNSGIRVSQLISVVLATVSAGILGYMYLVKLKKKNNNDEISDNMVYNEEKPEDTE